MASPIRSPLWLLLCCSLLLCYAPSFHTPPAARAQAVEAPTFLRNETGLRGRIATGDAWTIGGGFLYWARCDTLDPSRGYLRRWPLRGGLVRTISSSSFCQTTSWAADDSGLYYWNGAQIVRLVSAINQPFVEQPIAASPAPTAPIIVNNGTDVWRDYLFWVANNTLYSAHRTTFNQLAPPEPLGANARSLIFASDGNFYWFANGGLYRAPTACLGFGGGACVKQLLGAEAGINLTYASKRGPALGSSYKPLWTSGSAIRGLYCRPSGLGQTCSPGEAYRAPLGNTVGQLALDGDFLFWVENRQDCAGQLCTWSNQGRLMRWSLSGFLNNPEQIACCSPSYALNDAPGQVLAVDGWVYFDTSLGLARLSRNAPPINADLAAESYEVTQGVQDLNNSVPLVANRPTFVRLYGRKLRGSNATSVQALLYGTDATGAALPGSPLYPLNGGQDFMANNVNPSRLSLAGSWLFQLPTAWVGKGSIQLRPVVDPQNAWDDDNRSNNSLPARAFTFDAKAPICLVQIPVRTHAPAARYNDPSMPRLIDMARQLLPTSDIWLYYQDNDVAQLEARFGVPPWKYEPYALPDDGDSVLLALAQRETFSDDPDKCDRVGAVTHYVGLVHSQTPTNDGGGENLGKASTPGSVLYIKQITPADLASTAIDWQVQRFNTLGHELSHNYGRRHVNCGGPANPDMSFPYVDGKGTSCVLDDGRRNGRPLPSSQRYYGFDTANLLPIDPNTVADYMSYNQSYWVSDYTWRGVSSRIKTTALLSEAQAQYELAAAGDIVYLSGRINPTALTGSLDHAWVFPADALSEGIRTKLATAAAPRATLSQSTDGYLLRLRDADGALLDERVVTLAAVEDSESATQSFTLSMPAPSARVARIELLSGETLLASLEPRSSAPVVSILSPTGGEAIRHYPK